jgi:toxin-antitoxin system PIN domain toxin
MTPDVNVLLAASRSDHPHHRCSRDWLEDALDAIGRGERLRILPMVAAGFLRLVTHPRVFAEPTPLAAAQEFLGALLGSDGVELLPLGREWPLLESLCHQHQLQGNAIADGWIAAAVLSHRECLATFDRDFLPLLPPRQLLLLQRSA